MRTIKSAALIVILGFLSTSVQALATYQYVGLNYNTIVLDEDPPSGTFTTSMNVTGTFVVATALGEMPLGAIHGQVLGYVFSSGRRILTDSNSSIKEFRVAVDASGQITEWRIQVQTDFLVGNTNSGDQSPGIIIADWTDEPFGEHFNKATITECVDVDASGTCDDSASDIASTAGPPVGTWTAVSDDSDLDGVPDTGDNCILVPNGTIIPDAGGNSQLDSNGDGYGNFCDADLDNDLVVNGLDVGPFVAQFGTTGPDADFNGDGVVNGLDVGPFISMFGQAPGPSGLAP